MKTIRSVYVQSALLHFLVLLILSAFDQEKTVPNTSRSFLAWFVSQQMIAKLVLREDLKNTWARNFLKQFWFWWNKFMYKLSQISLHPIAKFVIKRTPKEYVPVDLIHSFSFSLYQFTFARNRSETSSWISRTQWPTLIKQMRIYNFTFWFWLKDERMLCKI